jgi:metal-dependent amidase/aminoacylase/carboxypeptidase family protein
MELEIGFEQSRTTSAITHFLKRPGIEHGEHGQAGENYQKNLKTGMTIITGENQRRSRAKK